DARALGLNAYFERYNPAAQAQLIERMAEAIRKGYWDAPEETRRLLAERWQALSSGHGVAGQPVTEAFIARMAAGYGLASAAAETAEGGQAPPDATPPAAAPAQEAVQGQVLEEMRGEEA